MYDVGRDLTDREKYDLAIKFLESIKECYVWDEYDQQRFNDAIEIIQSAKPLKQEPIKRGIWTDVHRKTVEGVIYKHYVCSVCGATMITSGMPLCRCPICKSKMQVQVNGVANDPNF